MRKFYAHLVEIETLVIELEELELSDKEKHHLAKLADSTIHNHIMNAILSELSETDKAAFVQLLRSDDHQKIWKFLEPRIDQVEERVKKVAREVKQELHEDVKEAKKLKKGD